MRNAEILLKDFIISGCVLCTKISRMVIFGLVFALYFLKLFVEKGYFDLLSLFPQIWGSYWVRYTVRLLYSFVGLLKNGG